MSNKEEIKTTYTAANGFAMPSTTKAKTTTEKDHVYCGTPDCCGKCESAKTDNDQSYASILYENKD
jgi:hypothetical protein